MKRSAAQEELFTEFEELKKQQRVHRFACQVGRTILKLRAKDDLSDDEIQQGIDLLRKNSPEDPHSDP